MESLYYVNDLKGLENLDWWIGRNKRFTTSKGIVVSSYKTLLNICKFDLDLALKEIANSNLPDRRKAEWNLYVTKYAKDLELRGKFIKGLSKFTTKTAKELSEKAPGIFSSLNPFTAVGGMITKVLIIGGIVTIVAIAFLPKILKQGEKLASKVL